MLGTLKKSRSNDLPYKIEELIQSLSNEEDRKLFTNIYKKVTKKNIIMKVQKRKMGLSQNA